MLTVEQTEVVRRIFEKSLEVNQRGRAEVFFDFHPHTSQVDVTIHVPNWEKSPKGKRMYFYYDKLDPLYESPKDGVYGPETIEAKLNEYL